MKNLKGAVAAVTGCASGIGRALAINLAGEGCHVAISDVNEEGLKETTELAGTPGVKITCHHVDVADRKNVTQFAQEVVSRHRKVNIIINNAGVGLSNTVADVSSCGVFIGPLTPHMPQPNMPSRVLPNRWRRN